MSDRVTPPDEAAAEGVDLDTAVGEPLLEVRDLQKSFGGITAVDGATFDIERGSITGLIGPNGAGKTTTFNLISGFYKPDGGTIRYDGRDLQAIMAPSRSEQAIWTVSAAFGLGGLAASAIALTGDVGTATVAGAGIVGAGVGVGGYYGQEYLKTSVLEYKRRRPFQASRAGLARTFQITRELEGLTVEENLMLAAQYQAGERLDNVWFRSDRVTEEEMAVRERADELLELLELEELRTEYAGNLSGGQRKLLELGRVLMTDPELILLDEPVAGVNPTLTQNLLQRIEELRDEGYTFCIVEHDMEIIMNVSDTIIVMSEGKKLMEGTPEEVRSDDRVLEAYLGG